MTHGRAPVLRLAQRFSDVMRADWAPLIRHERGHDAVTGQRDSQGDRERHVDVPVAVGPPARVDIEQDAVTPTTGGCSSPSPIPAGAPGLRVHGDPS